MFSANQIEIMNKYPVNDEQKEFFFKRTREHIDRVKENAKRLVEKFPALDGFTVLVTMHDNSKFLPSEIYGYIWMTSVYNMGYKYPSKEVKEIANKAWKHHYMVNLHHPEYWINNEFTKLEDMDEIDLAHMVCDWAAMSQEFNNSLNDWYHNKALKKFKFNDEQKEIIEKYINVFKEVL